MKQIKDRKNVTQLFCLLIRSTASGVGISKLGKKHHQSVAVMFAPHAEKRAPFEKLGDEK